MRPWPVRGWVSFHDVSFRYPGGPERDALHEVTFTARPRRVRPRHRPERRRKVHALQAPHPLLRPHRGRDLPGRRPARRTYPWTFLRENVALLPQETLILHGTIRENIECGRPGASDAEIERAARAADAHAFIGALPDGYDTEIAPGTAVLSGGQLQRVALRPRDAARPPPSSYSTNRRTGLDGLAARRVVQPLRRLVSGRTTVMITHDLTLAPDADRILVVDGGRLVEEGTHGELMARGGVYAGLAGPMTGVDVETTMRLLPQPCP